MLYRVKNEYIDSWSDSVEFAETPIVDDAEIARLASGWGGSVDVLMAQVEPIVGYEPEADDAI